MANEENKPPPLASLVIPQVGGLRQTDDPWEPFHLLDPDGVVVPAVSEYLKDLQAAGRRAATQRSYGMDLLRWFRFLWAIGVPWNQATRIEARDFSRWLQIADKPVRPHWRSRDRDDPPSPPIAAAGPATPNAVTGKPARGRAYGAATRAHSESVLRHFYEFHLEVGTGPMVNPFPLTRDRANGRPGAHRNPMDPPEDHRSGLFRPRLVRRVPRNIPDDRFNELFAGLSCHRDRALVAFWISTGVRAAELLGATRGARLFLAGRARSAGDPTGVEGLSEEEVSAFLLAEASRGLSSKSLQGRVAELRSLLRFLYLQALIATPLGEGVPPVPGWKDTAVPRRLAATEVQALLDSCDRATVTGKRDLAVLLLLARMGLRAAEVAGLELESFHWRVGELVVRGKGGRCDQMPLPGEVGEAVAAYLVEARPRVESRTVFLTLVAPPRPMTHTTVGQMVWRQCRIAGLEPVRAHRLRHALATELLSQGVRLPEIAQMLRQRDLATTAIYAKVDYPALRGLALPWLVVR